MADGVTLNYIIATMIVLLSVATVILNGFCIDVIRKSKTMLRKPSTLFILNVFLVQFAQGLVIIPFYLANNADFKDEAQQYWYAVLCSLVSFAYNVTFFGTCLGVLLISIDRFFAVHRIVSYRLIMTRVNVISALIAKWMYLIITCATPFLISITWLQSEDEPQNDNMDVTTCHNTTQILCPYSMSKQTHFVMLLVNTFIPYALIVSIYLHVVEVVKYFELKAHQRQNQRRRRQQQQQQQQPQQHQQQHQQRRQLKKDYLEVFEEINNNNKISIRIIKLKRKDIAKHKKINRLAFVVSFLYAIQWLPSICYYTLKYACFESIPCSFSDHYTDFVIKSLVFLNGIVIPLSYCIYQKEFRFSLWKPGKYTGSKNTISSIRNMKLISYEDAL